MVVRSLKRFRGKGGQEQEEVVGFSHQEDVVGLGRGIVGCLELGSVRLLVLQLELLVVERVFVVKGSRDCGDVVVQVGQERG